MNTLRSLLFNIFFIGGTALTIIIGVPMLAFPPPLLTRFIVFWANAMIAGLRVICGIRLEVTGMENLPPGGVIIAAKHQSAFDTMVWLKLVPTSVYVAKKELLEIPGWGWLARATVPRLNPWPWTTSSTDPGSSGNTYIFQLVDPSP